MKNALILTVMLAIAACKPPPSDDATIGRIFTGKPDAPPAPLDSPNSEGGFWADSKTAGRIIYGQAGNAPLMAIQCVGDGKNAQLQITRLSPADKGAQAFFALVGNNHVARIPVDAVEVPGGHVWQALTSPDDPDLNALTGPKEVTATLPGAGMVTLYPSEKLKMAVNECRMRVLPAPEIGILDEEETIEDELTVR